MVFGLDIGAGGMIFDWIRMIYERMEYVVCHNSESETSEMFKSIITVFRHFFFPGPNHLVMVL